MRALSLSGIGVIDQQHFCLLFLKVVKGELVVGRFRAVDFLAATSVCFCVSLLCSRKVRDVLDFTLWF